MILKKIELENIKTHKKTVIPFQKGLNVFHGENGTGKSTILEMIGFVLFDYLEGRKHDIYVREVHGDKPEFGVIKLWVIGLNNEPYIIERTIGKPSIMVYNAFTNKELKQISDITQLKKWIRIQLGLSSAIELDKLFTTSIGIPQGTFITPFQRNPGDRKNYFDPILSLIIYETMWLKLHQLLTKAYSPALLELEKMISEISGEIKNKGELIEKKDYLTKEVDSLGNSLEDGRKQYSLLKSKFDELKEIKENLRFAQEEVQKLDIKKENLLDTISVLQTQIGDAKKAFDICEKTKKNSDKYDLLRESQATLQIELTNLQIEQKKLQEIIQKYMKVSTEKESIIKSKIEAEKAIERCKDLELEDNRFKKVERDIIEIDQEITRITTIEDELTKKQKRLNDLIMEIDTLKQDLKDLPELKNNFDKLVILENEKIMLEQSIAKVENELVRISQDNENLEHGICPIFNQQCINLKEQLASVDGLEIQIKQKKELLSDKINKVESLRKQLKDKEDLALKIKTLEGVNIRLEESTKQFTSLQEDFKESEKEVKEKETYIKKKGSLEVEIEKLKPIVEEFMKCKTKAEELSIWEQKLGPLEVIIQDLENEKQFQEKMVKNLEYIPKALNELQLDLDKLRIDYELYQTNKNLANTLPAKKKDVEGTSATLKKIEVDLKEKNELIKTLTSQYDEQQFIEYESSVKEYEKSITQLETQLTEKKARIKELTEDLNKIEQSEQELEKYNREKDTLEVQIFFVKKLRIWIREFVPKMRKALIHQINNVASDIYRNIREEEDALLTWQEDYDIHISTSKTTKNFFQLSGGEKMSAAIAVRLAILKVLTNAKFAFFDEPTTNLDNSTRKNLSKYIYNIKGFEQLFIISHDDSFRRHSEYVIHFSKDENEITHIDTLTQSLM